MSHRKKWFCCAVAAIMIAYAGTYFLVSRRGMREAERYNMDCFIYVPFGDWVEEDEYRMHLWLRLYFFPANQIDQLLFDGMAPAKCLLLDLS